MNPQESRHDSDRHPISELVAFASQAEDAGRQLTRMTLHPPAFTPADLNRILGHVFDTVTALPQLATQLGENLGNPRDRFVLAIDRMTATGEPELAIDTARLHLDEASHPALATCRRLHAARHEVAHISATSVDGAQVLRPRSVLQHRKTAGAARGRPVPPRPNDQSPTTTWSRTP